MTKRSLQLHLTQQTTLTPQLQQSLRLLQMSTVDLLQDAEQWLQSNPLLERGNDEESASSDESGEAVEDAVIVSEMEERPWEGETPWSSHESSRDDEDREWGVPSHALSLQDHLRKELSLIRANEIERTLIEVLIDALDERGYLIQPLEEIAGWLPANLESGAEELRIALRLLQSFAPPGVGAHDARECLLLQLNHLAATTGAPATCALATRLVDQHLKLLANKDFTQLKKVLGCSEDELRQAHLLILHLHPRPGALFSSASTPYVLPDVIVKKRGAHWHVALNPAATPTLRLHSHHARTLSQMTHSARPADLQQQLQEARWLIKSLHQRCDTILRVSEVIINRQRAFLDFGPMAIRPMVLRDVAQTLGLHESTVSRATNQKYIATPRGIFELKHFFSSALATEMGGSRSSTSIRAQIESLLKKESNRYPLSDSEIVDALKEEGIKIARRTVAKYRGAMNIPPAHLRKTLGPTP